MRRLISMIAVAAVLSLPVASDAASPGDSAQLSAFRRLLEQGCFGYIYGQRPFGDVLKGLGLRKLKIFQLNGTYAVRWVGGGHGLAMQALPHFCGVRVHGKNIDAYRAVVVDVLRAQLGADPVEDAHSGQRLYLPGQVTNCRRLILYSYYQDHPGEPRFTVDIARQTACPAPDTPGKDGTSGTG
jgi:hypothetical protein